MQDLNLILSLQKELGSVRGLPEDMQYVKNAMAILSEARKQQAAQRTGYQPTHGHVFIGGKCECSEQVSLPPFARR